MASWHAHHTLRTTCVSFVRAVDEGISSLQPAIRGSRCMCYQAVAALLVAECRPQIRRLVWSAAAQLPLS